MTIEELKQYIFEQGKIECVLEELKCHNIKLDRKQEWYYGCFPDGDNTRGVNISNNKYLNFHSFSRNIHVADNKDIIDLMQYITGKNFIESVKYLHDILGLEYSPYKKKAIKEEKKYDPLSMFKKIRAKRRRIDVADIKYIDKAILNDYVPLLHIDWLRDGIIEKTRKKFGLMYSYRRKRVVIPHHYWLNGGLIGTNMRTTIENYEELGIPKYLITENMSKSANLYGLFENYDDIQEAGYVVVYESERSVLKRDSLNDPTGVAISGHNLSDEQTRILIGLNVEIVLAMDKDVQIDEVRSMCEKFYNIRRVSYMYDKHGILDKKDAPCDKDNKIYEFLFKYRVSYDVKEHKALLKSLEKR